MAQVKDNIITAGLRGKVGNLVFRKRGNKTTAYVMSPRKGSPTKKQTDAQLQFAGAVAQARHALKDETQRKQFEELAKHDGYESAYSAAIAYFMKSI